MITQLKRLALILAVTAFMAANIAAMACIAHPGPWNW
jgi:hypothetical protein